MIAVSALADCSGLVADGDNVFERSVDRAIGLSEVLRVVGKSPAELEAWTTSKVEVAVDEVLA